MNFHGYRRHLADVDFWIDLSELNFQKLLRVLQEMGSEVNTFPEKVTQGLQNISIKFSSSDNMNIELITAFSLSKTFDEAFANSEKVEIKVIVRATTL